MKSLSDLFSKYTPDSVGAEFFADAGEYTVARSTSSADRFEITVFPSKLWSKKDIYHVEDGLLEAYDRKYLVRFNTKYPSSFFCNSYIEEILRDAVRRNYCSPGFLEDCEYARSGNVITIKIPFGSGGVDHLTLRQTAKNISSLIFAEFGLEYRVEIVSSENHPVYEQTREMQEFYSDLNRRCLESLGNYDNIIRSREQSEEMPSPEAAQPQQQLKPI